MRYTRGQRVAVSLYYGSARGTVVSTRPGYITVHMDDDNYMVGSPRETFDLSRRTVKVI